MYKGKKPNKYNQVEFKVGEEFVFLGRRYKTVREIPDGLFACGQCYLPTCFTNIACSSIKREDGIGVEFVLVNDKEEGGEK